MFCMETASLGHGVIKYALLMDLDCGTQKTQKNLNTVVNTMAPYFIY